MTDANDFGRYSGRERARRGVCDVPLTAAERRQLLQLIDDELGDDDSSDGYDEGVLEHARESIDFFDAPAPIEESYR